MIRRTILLIFIIITNYTFSQVIWSENFDGNVSNWVVGVNQPTPTGIPGLNYTTNGSCNNYWVINSDHTPDYNNNYLGHRDICNNLPNPIPNNKSLHITYQSCAPINGIEPAQPNGGDAYSWQGSQCNSDQWAYYNADINTIGACGLYLEFWAYLGGDTSEINDYVDRSILYSTDGGNTWKLLVEDIANIFDAAGNRIYDITTAGTCKGWTKFSIKLPSDAENIPNLRIAFRWRNENPSSPSAGDYTTSSGFNIDDIKIVNRSFDADFSADKTTTCRNTTVYMSAFFLYQPPQNPLNPYSFNYSWNIIPSTGVSYVGGTSPSDKDIHVQFANAGTYTVTLTVTQVGGDCNGQSETITKTNYITILPSCPPIASFTSNITKVCATNPTPPSGSVTQVQFTDLSTSAYPITSWNWNITGPGTPNFVGGTNSSSQNPVVEFDTPGLYTVQLTVTNQDGSDDTTITNYIEVIDCQCTGVGGGSGTQITTLDSVTFNNGSLPTSWSTTGGNTDNTWVVNSNYNPLTPNQPSGIAGSPNSPYLHVTCNGSNFLCSFLYPGDQAVFYDNSTGTPQSMYVYSDVYNVSSYDSVKLSYWTVINGGTAYGKCEYSVDGGTTWTQLGSNLQGINTWTQFNHTIDFATTTPPNPSTIQFRWLFYIPHDGGGQEPPLCLDDIIIHAYQQATSSGPSGVYTCPLATEFCEGDNITITFNAIGTFNPGNVFTAQLSDASGSFASPITLGTLSASGTNLTNQTITATIPTPPTCGGTGYRIRVISSDPAYTGPPNVQDNGSDITIKCAPQNFNITGDTLVCESALVTYSVPSQTGVSYSWTVTGGTITSGQNTNSITIQWGTAGTGTITATITNGCGSTSATLNVSIAPGAPTTSPITASSTNICVGDNVTYSVTNNTGSSYTWTITGGGTITSGQNTNSITVQWNTTGVYVVKVVEETGCGKDSSEITVVVNDVPSAPTITGAISACPNDTITYYIPPSPGATYTWSATNGNIIGGQGTNAVMIEWTSIGTGTVSVTVTNSCGSANASLNVTIGTNITISGFSPTDICKTSGTTTQATHSINPISGATYTWNVISGGTLVSSSGNSATIDWDNNATTHKVQVIVSTSCGTADSTFTITLTDIPALANVTGNTTVCTGATETYTTSLSNSAPNTTIIWIVVNGNGSPSTGTGTTANVTWNTAGPDTIRFIATNSCGSDTSDLVINIQNASPVSDISGNMVPCVGTSETYSINPVSGAINYNWTISGNGTIQSGQGTENITINWTSPGQAILSISVQQGCGTITKDTTITISDKPDIIIGNAPSPICINSTEDYNVVLNTNAVGVSYNWYLTQNLGTPSTGNDSIASINWNSVGNDTIIFVAQNSCGSDTLKIPVVIEEIYFNVSIDDSVLCEGDMFNYKVSGTFNSIFVDFGDGTTSTDTIGSHSYTSTGTYIVKFIGSNGSCSDSLEKRIEVYPIPSVSISADPNPSFLPDLPTIYVTQQDADTIKYLFGSGFNDVVQVGNFVPIKVPYNEPGNYLVSVIASNEGGCSSIDTITVVINEGIVIFIPNAFTPNGDGINDYFEIVSKGLEKYEVNVYDRWGNVVATFKEGERWDGTSNGQAVPEGTYVVIIKAKGLDNKYYERSGTITIIR